MIPETPPAARRLPVWLGVVGALVVALGVGIPVGLLANHGGNSSGASTGPTVPTAAPATTRPPSPTSSRVPLPTPSSGPPAGLSDVESTLWSSLRLDGVVAQTCRGYPEGEQLPGVTASIQCDVADGTIGQPITFHQFPDAASVDGYMNLRASAIQPSLKGSCKAGGEADTDWNSGGGRLGRLVCVHNIKDTGTYFKMVWSSDATYAVGIVQDESPSSTWTWWSRHAGGQFARS